MNRWLKYILYGFAWLFVVSYVIFSASRVKRHRESLVLSGIEVRIVDSTQRSCLVHEQRVREWIDRSGYAKISSPISQVDLAGLESVISSNGFIAGVKAYLTYDGVLKVEVEQREPIMRLRLDGYDSYVTRDGFIFASPLSSAHYSMVVTGDYRAIFGAGYEGYLDDLFEERMSQGESDIAAIEKQKHPLYDQQRELRGDWREFYRTGYIKPKFFEPSDEYAVRLREKRIENAAKRRSLNYRARLIASNIEKIEQKRINEEKKINKFVEKYEDFKKLITFVEMINRDRFWSSEIVQIVVGTSSYGEIELRLVPRSSNHIIVFGAIEREQAKLDKLETFYKDVLKSVGWEHYKVIDIQYENQVVCR